MTRKMSFYGVLLAGTLLVACSSGDSSALLEEGGSAASPTVPLAAPTVSDPAVLVNGARVLGELRNGTNHATLFQVTVAAPGGASTVRQVTMAYSQPGVNHQGDRCYDQGCGAETFTGTVVCYDDGTHGDDLPGDGIYHYMDPNHRIGCNGQHAHPGEYTYSFYCEDTHGQVSNTASVTVRRR